MELHALARAEEDHHFGHRAAHPTGEEPRQRRQTRLDGNLHRGVSQLFGHAHHHLFHVRFGQPSRAPRGRRRVVRVRSPPPAALRRRHPVVASAACGHPSRRTGLLGSISIVTGSVIARSINRDVPAVSVADNSAVHLPAFSARRFKSARMALRSPRTDVEHAIRLVSTNHRKDQP